MKRANEFWIRFFWCMVTLCLVLLGDGIYDRHADQMTCAIIMLILTGAFTLVSELYYD